MEDILLKITVGKRVIAIVSPLSTVLMVAEDLCLDCFGVSPQMVVYKKLDSYMYSHRDEVEYHNFTAELRDSSASCLVRARNGQFIWVEKFPVATSFYFQRLLAEPMTSATLPTRIVTSEFLTGLIGGSKTAPQLFADVPVVVNGEDVAPRDTDELSFDDVFDCAAYEDSSISPDSVSYIASNPSLRRTEASVPSTPIELPASNSAPTEDDYGWYVSLDSFISTSLKGIFKL